MDKKHLTHLCNAIGMALIKEGGKPNYPMIEDTIKVLARLMVSNEEIGEKLRKIGSNLK